MSTKERTSRGAPCIFCGDVGYDMRMHYQEGTEEEVVHYCHKTNAAKGDIINVGTEQYICIAAGKVLPVVGAFDLWKKYLSKEEWKSRQNNRSTYRSSVGNGRDMKISRSSCLSSMNPKSKQELLPGEVATKSPKEQHAFNMYLAQLLLLEDKHKESFKKEWESSTRPELLESILKRYPRANY